jgi:apolipoprotein N-acyltransferase
MPFWILSYIGSNFGLIIVTVLAVVALGAVAWFAKNWKVAVAAAAVLAAGFAYMQIDKSAYQRRVSEEAAAQVRLLQGRLATLEAVNTQYASKVLTDAKAISELKRKASETPPNSAACLPLDATRRVRSIH